VREARIVALDARTFKGGVGFNAHQRCAGGEPGHATRWPESPDTMANAAPCPE
jgi:hypothetical protein